MTSDWLIERATILRNAWIKVVGSPPPNKNAIVLCLAQAIHESQAGACWDNSGCWGCCDLRALNAAEVAAFKAGTLKVGWWLYPDNTFGPDHRPDSIGTIRGDSDPNNGAFHVWFFAGTQDAGAAYYLRAGVRGARHVLADPACSPETFATALYVEVCYFGGTTSGSRPCGKRHPPYNAAELANINAYAGAMAKLMPAITSALAGWHDDPAPIDPATLLVQPWTLPSNDDEPPPDAA